MGQPPVGIILGSGLSGFCAQLSDARRTSFVSIPGAPSASVAGHEGFVVDGELSGRRVICIAGRVHAYEGHGRDAPVFFAHFLARQGVRELLVANAAGAISSRLQPGQLMLIRDQVNMSRRVLLEDARLRASASPVYDEWLSASLLAAAARSGIPLEQGVYAGVLGPSYETPAEVRMLRLLGADAVGMSTVQETAAAAGLGLRVAGLSCLTNRAAGLSPSRLSHEQVLEGAAAVEVAFGELIRELLVQLDQTM